MAVSALAHATPEGLDCLRAWWISVRHSFRGIRRLVMYLDNGPKNSGRRTQFLKRMIEFSDWSGLEIHLVYYPPYRGKATPEEPKQKRKKRPRYHGLFTKSAPHSYLPQYVVAAIICTKDDTK